MHHKFYVYILYWRISSEFRQEGTTKVNHLKITQRKNVIKRMEKRKYFTITLSSGIVLLVSLLLWAITSKYRCDTFRIQLRIHRDIFAAFSVQIKLKMLL